MTREIPQADSAAAVNPAHLLAVFDPDADDPISQSIRDVVRAIFTQALEDKLGGIQDRANNFSIAANSVTAAQARATSEAHWGEWAVRLGIAQPWADIPANTAIRVGKIALHSGAVYCCIAAHAKGVMGPAQDRGNWLRVSDHPSVVGYNQNTIIPESSRGWTYRATGNTTQLLSLPDASGADEVENGWDVVVSNGSAADQTVRPNGADRVGGNAALTLAPGRVVRLQKVATGVWILVADTKDESGEAGAPFMPSQANLYEAVKAIFEHNTAVSADDANLELDFAAGAAGALADNSIAPIKLLANRDVDKKSLRARMAGSSIGLVANALPAVANHNTGDTIIIGRGGATVVPFRELATPADEETATVAGDVMMLLAAGWTRIGNLFSGGIAAAAARTIADANKAAVDRLPVFARISINPAGIPDAVPPSFITLTLDSKLTDRTITRIQCSIEGQNFANIVRNANPIPPATDHAEPFNQAFNAGGVINGSFTPIPA